MRRYDSMHGAGHHVVLKSIVHAAVVASQALQTIHHLWNMRGRTDVDVVAMLLHQNKQRKMLATSATTNKFQSLLRRKCPALRVTLEKLNVERLCLEANKRNDKRQKKKQCKNLALLF